MAPQIVVSGPGYKKQKISPTSNTTAEKFDSSKTFVESILELVDSKLAEPVQASTPVTPQPPVRTGARCDRSSAIALAAGLSLASFAVAKISGRWAWVTCVGVLPLLLRFALHTQKSTQQSQRGVELAA